MRLCHQEYSSLVILSQRETSQKQERAKKGKRGKNMSNKELGNMLVLR